MRILQQRLLNQLRCLCCGRACFDAHFQVLRLPHFSLGSCASQRLAFGTDQGRWLLEQVANKGTGVAKRRSGRPHHVFHDVHSASEDMGVKSSASTGKQEATEESEEDRTLRIAITVAIVMAVLLFCLFICIVLVLKYAIVQPKKIT
eukprot:6197605-Pleurochrysis_carterae.AAC.2